MIGYHSYQDPRLLPPDYWDDGRIEYLAERALEQAIEVVAENWAQYTAWEHEEDHPNMAETLCCLLENHLPRNIFNDLRETYDPIIHINYFLTQQQMDYFENYHEFA